MDPDGAGFMTIDSEDATGDGHAFEWIKRVGDGPHVIELMRDGGQRRDDVHPRRLDDGRHPQGLTPSLKTVLTSGTPGR